MAESKSPSSKDLPRTSAPGDPQPPLGGTKVSDAGSKEAEQADKHAADAAESQAKAAEAQSESQKAKEEAAQKQMEDAKKNALDEDGNNKYTEDGLVIGIDGENPVSNSNPDPLAVQSTYVL